MIRIKICRHCEVGLCMWHYKCMAVQVRCTVGQYKCTQAHGLLGQVAREWDCLIGEYVGVLTSESTLCCQSAALHGSSGC